MDRITTRLHVQGLPDITYRAKRIVAPQIITLTYLPDAPGPVNGIYPASAAVEGPCRAARPGGMRTPTRTTEVFYRAWPQHWPQWLIELGAENRPNHP